MPENEQNDDISKNIEDIYTTATDSADVVTETPLRLWTVGEDISYTGTNIESTDPSNKAYYETIIQRGHGVLGSTLATVAVAPFFIALWYKMYEKFIGKPYRQGYDHFLAKLKKAKLLKEQEELNDELFQALISTIESKETAKSIYETYIKGKKNSIKNDLSNETNNNKFLSLTKWYQKRQLQKKLKKIENYEQIFWLQLEAQLHLQQQNKTEYRIDFSRIDKIAYLRKISSSKNTPEKQKNEIAQAATSSKTQEDTQSSTYSLIYEDSESHGSPLKNEPNKLKVTNYFDRFARWYEKKCETNPVARAIQGIWKALSTQSMTFWIVMLPTMLLFGGSAIASSALLSWSILGLSIVPLVIYGGVKLGTYIYHRFKKQPHDNASEDKKPLLEKKQTEEKYIEVSSTETEKLSRQFKDTLFLKERQQAYQSKYAATIKKIDGIKKQLKGLDLKSKQTELNDDEPKSLLADEEQTSGPKVPLLTANKDKGKDKDDDSDPAKSLLYQKLLGSKKSQIASSAINISFAAVGGFIIPQFLLWVGSFLASAISLSGVGVAAATAAAFIGGPIMMFAIGIPLMIFFTANAVIQNRVKQLDERANILKAITEKDESGKPLYIKYQEIKNKNHAAALRNAIAEKRQQIDQKLNSYLKSKKHC